MNNIRDAKVGDIVRLMNSGPRMTVTRAVGNVGAGLLCVMWFDKVDCLQEAYLPAECLTTEVASIEQLTFRYRKKPVVIEAFKCIGDTLKPEWFTDAIARDDVRNSSPNTWYIRTLKGWMPAYSGDWIIRDMCGEIYPLESETFEATYELAGDEP